MKTNDILIYILLALVIIQLALLIFNSMKKKQVEEKYILESIKEYAKKAYQKTKDLVTPTKRRRFTPTQIASMLATTETLDIQKEEELLNRLENKKRGISILEKLTQTGKEILDVFKAPDIMPLSVKKFLDKYGNFPIVQMKVCRSPIIRAIANAAEFLSNKLYRENLRDRLKKVGYDDLFHLYSLLTLRGPDGTQMLVKMEKNEIVSVIEVGFDYFSSQGGGECRDVNLEGRTITLNAMFSDAIATDPHRFWVYDQTYHNCQIFLLLMLRGSNLLTTEMIQFIDQDAASLLAGYGALKKIGKGVTDLAANLVHLKERVIDKIRNWLR